MARPQDLKRQRADNCTEEERPQKKPRSTKTLWNYPPRYYDNLSKVWLTRLALRELDRRNSIAPQSKPSVRAGEYSRDLAEFARRGGPDLCHLRGVISANITAKDKNFEQHLHDYGIYLPDDLGPLALNTSEIRERLARERSSLSPSQFSNEQFKTFQGVNRSAVFENDIMAKVIPIISTKPQPDFFDGARIHEIDKAIRDDDQMYSLIIPSKHKNVPVANNLFLEVKRSDGSAAVMERQACYDGAYRARAMHSLQNYDEEKPVYDSNAHPFSSTYHNGQLYLYAHHATAPATSGGGPEYHVTMLDVYALLGTRERFIEGATAFRNARGLAKEHRDRLIRVANARARGASGQ
ncbi:hypothetical protein F4810DRAFT_704704 [Camillea tinctor]|nr:hypothetical protein F4810DRAFT_704704 [Camillea tinctor]